MLHLTAEIARQMGKKICVCLSTGKRSSHALLTMFSHYVVLRRCHRRVLLGCAPAYDANSLSQYQPEWQCWEPDVEWVVSPRKMR